MRQCMLQGSAIVHIIFSGASASYRCRCQTMTPDMKMHKQSQSCMRTSMPYCMTSACNYLTAGSSSLLAGYSGSTTRQSQPASSWLSQACSATSAHAPACGSGSSVSSPRSPRGAVHCCQPTRLGCGVRCVWMQAMHAVFRPVMLASIVRAWTDCSMSRPACLLCCAASGRARLPAWLCARRSVKHKSALLYCCSLQFVILGTHNSDSVCSFESN